MTVQPPSASRTSNNLSAGEIRLLELLPKDGTRIDTEQLTRRFYARRVAPYNARIVVMNLVRALQKKTRGKVKRSPRAGPNSVEVWRNPEPR